MTADYRVGDTREVIKGIADGSVDLIASSPPFLALRSYVPEGHASKGDEIGSEANPAAFIDMLLGLTAEWGRVLAPHGSIAIELGDTYAGGGQGPDPGKYDAKASTATTAKSHGEGWPRAKSLALIPQLYAVALAYGINPLTGAPSPAGRWLVRNVIVWHRPNPAVGALGDKVRPSTSYIVVATRSPKRWFDLTAVRGPVSENTHQRLAKGVEVAPRNGKSADRDGNYGTMPELATTAGAPPLDAWFDEHDGTHDTWTLTTQPSRISVKVPTRVPCGPDDGGERTASPDCPVHGDHVAPAPTAHDDALEGDLSPRTSRTDDRRDLAPFAPVAGGASTRSDLGSPAMPCDTESNRTAPAQSTNQPDTPSAQTAARTLRTSVSPESCGGHPDTSGSSSDAVCPRADGHEMEPRSDRTPDSESACTCTFHLETTSIHSHYAMWPAKLAERLILSMCPREVCQVCGEPRRRIEQRDADVIALNLTARNGRTKDGRGDEFAYDGYGGFTTATSSTVGWTDCGHNDYRPGLVLDPFAGSGTTLAVADLHGRDAIGIDFDERNHAIYPARYAEVRRALFGSPIPDANQMELAL